MISFLILVCFVSESSIDKKLLWLWMWLTSNTLLIDSEECDVKSFRLGYSPVNSIRTSLTGLDTEAPGFFNEECLESFMAGKKGN